MTTTTPYGRSTALRRSTTNRVFGGVCGGLAERYGWPAWRVRLLAVLSCVLPGPQFVLYLALWLVIPGES